MGKSGEEAGKISIHALREEGDWMAVPRFAALFRFLSTPSARRATWPDDAVNYCTEFLSTPSARRATGDASGVQRAPVISIHALREEGDPNHLAYGVSILNFYPRPPRGGRLGGLMQVLDEHIFLSTPSARRATHRLQLRQLRITISIHALREEGDFQRRPGAVKEKLFLSTPSARRATAQLSTRKYAFADFYPRPPRGGRPVR